MHHDALNYEQFFIKFGSFARKMFGGSDIFSSRVAMESGRCGWNRHSKRLAWKNILDGM
jgi:hypothetical protein